MQFNAISIHTCTKFRSFSNSVNCSIRSVRIIIEVSSCHKCLKCLQAVAGNVSTILCRIKDSFDQLTVLVYAIRAFWQ